ncbi:hypothetical protein HKX48_009196 [Thoreauomyces humboldtii]|nr:hypothetical protein HKX48_009196 [Thoreauomyces humboldtii]
MSKLESETLYSIASAQILHWLKIKRPETVTTNCGSPAFPLTPLFVGILGPQGSGKTTLTELLCERFSSLKLSVLSLSIDDLYLTKLDQDLLAFRDPTNKLYQFRGEPGTHDFQLAHRVLDEILDSHRNRGEVRIPRYDKTLHQGRGDRVNEKEWTSVRGPFHIVLLEGWCVGFPPASPSRLEELLDPNIQTIASSLRSVLPAMQRYPPSHIALVNEALHGYRSGITDRLDALLHVHTHDLRYVYEWRREQERDSWRKTGRGLTQDQVDDFVDRFMPGYVIGLDGLLEDGWPQSRDSYRRITIGEKREETHKARSSHHNELSTTKVTLKTRRGTGLKSSVGDPSILLTRGGGILQALRYTPKRRQVTGFPSPRTSEESNAYIDSLFPPSGQEEEVEPPLPPFFPRPATGPLPDLRGLSPKDLQLPYDPRGRYHGARLLRQIDVEMRTRLDLDRRAELFRPGSPDAIEPGSVLLVEQVTSRSRPRTQVFAGVLIAIRRKGVMSNIIVRNYVLGTGVEMVFPIFSPSVKRIKVLKRVTGVVTGDTMYYLRDKPSASPLGFTKIDEMVIRDREQERKAKAMQGR